MWGTVCVRRLDGALQGRGRQREGKGQEGEQTCARWCITNVATASPENAAFGLVTQHVFRTSQVDPPHSRVGEEGKEFLRELFPVSCLSPVKVLPRGLIPRSFELCSLASTVVPGEARPLVPQLVYSEAQYSPSVGSSSQGQGTHTYNLLSNRQGVRDF